MRRALLLAVALLFSFDGACYASGPLHVSATNGRYFEDAVGNIVYLTGSHTWTAFQDGTSQSDPPPAFDYTAYLDFLAARGHNFLKLWMWEQATWSVESTPVHHYLPNIYQRTGPGNALDGKLRFDVTLFNQAYFDRMRARTIEAGNRGMYVSIQLFQGWSPYFPKDTLNATNAWQGNPFHPSNNVNSVDGDTDNDESGEETHTLAIAAITALQDDYVRKVVDTVNDLDNVLYEISNESNGNSELWQYHMIDLIHTYEAGKPKQHPVGMTVEWPGGANADLTASNAEWISPNGDLEPEVIDTGKVVLLDTDHLCGICGDRAWVWKGFTRGGNILFMDRYDDSYKVDGWSAYDINNATDVSLRANMGYAKTYAQRVDLKNTAPSTTLCSTTYCLAKNTATGAAFIVYAPSGGTFSVNLTAQTGLVEAEWLNPATGATQAGTTVAGGASRNFTPPFGGDAVLLLESEPAKCCRATP